MRYLHAIGNGSWSRGCISCISCIIANLSFKISLRLFRCRFLFVIEGGIDCI